MKISPWQLGNTTVRNPLRIQGGLTAYSLSNVEGRIRGGEVNEKAFIKVLADAEVVTLSQDRADDTYSVGRKWRSALDSLGFIYPEIPASAAGVVQADVGPLDYVTENGHRLIAADTVFAMQDCFLRALVAFTLPNPAKPKFNNYAKFSPIVHVIRFLLALEAKSAGDAYLTFNEIASYVQMSGGTGQIDTLITTILKERKDRLLSTNKKAFDRAIRDNAAVYATCNSDSLKDYADMNIRYLKASGLFQAKGRGISLLPERKVLAKKLVEQYVPPASDKEYFIQLCKGATLPTDNKKSAIELVEDLAVQLKARGVDVDVSVVAKQEVPEIEALRYNLEEQLFSNKEEEFAAKQRNSWEEISKYLELLIERRGRTVELPNGEEIKVPKDEAPAYFEWVIWRAFLAINDLKCSPQDARGFKIDQDFLPINTAAGGQPDLTFVFEDFVLVVEVTFTTNSRQEAAEGEPVRRHVADVLEQYQGQKPVYGLFIANSVDSNTAETFRIGCWYNREDTRLKLDITPMTLTSFKTYFDSLMSSSNIHNSRVKTLLEACNQPRDTLHGPEWKRKVEEIVKETAESL
jgi:hypothetical protein